MCVLEVFHDLQKVIANLLAILCASAPSFKRKINKKILNGEHFLMHSSFIGLTGSNRQPANVCVYARISDVKYWWRIITLCKHGVRMKVITAGLCGPLHHLAPQNPPSFPLEQGRLLVRGDEWRKIPGVWSGPAD